MVSEQVLEASYPFGRNHSVVMGMAVERPGDLHLENTCWYCYTRELVDEVQGEPLEDTAPLEDEGTVLHMPLEQIVPAQPEPPGHVACLELPLVAAAVYQELVIY
jgi:hypothetical protein